ncbi:hypothetical protein [Streptomyces sp. SudanB182_2057]|uniref:hypothetical protein n=1 Tax=Streptomyces sp. SudanB182_2057 TaxID=3035281 RepID=UPI003F55672A
MATDHSTPPTGTRPRPRTSRPALCALAAATLPLALHFPTPWTTSPPSTPAATASPTAAGTASPPPPHTTPPPESGTPSPESGTPSPSATPHHPTPTSSGPEAPPTPTTQAPSKRPRATRPRPPKRSTTAPLDRPPARPARTPWTLHADRLVLRAATFHGTVTVPTAAGSRRALKFTVRSLEALDLDLTAGEGDAAIRLRTGPTTTSTLKGEGSEGMVTLYVRALSGTLTALGGVPLPEPRTVSLSPDSVPAWLAPAGPASTITFTDVTVSPLAQYGGNLTLTGLRLDS